MCVQQVTLSKTRNGSDFHLFEKMKRRRMKCNILRIRSRDRKLLSNHEREKVLQERE